MTDRIADPWGDATPIRSTPRGPLESTPSSTPAWTPPKSTDGSNRRACSAANGCGCDIAVKDGRIVGVRGRAVDRVNHGRLGPKGLFGWQANNSPDRLTRPLVRENGELVETDWDTAMGRIVEQSQALLRDIGPLAFGFHNDGDRGQSG